MPRTKNANVTVAATPDDRVGFSVDDVAARYRVSAALVRLEISRGRLRAVRIARRVILLKDDIDAWLNRDADEA